MLINKIKALWKNLSAQGPKLEIERQIFISTSIITVVFLLAMAVLNLWIQQFFLASLLLVTATALIVVNFLPSVRKNYKRVIFIFGFLSYPILAVNFYLNDGVFGPTFYVLLLIHIILLPLSNRKTYGLWIGINVVFFTALLYVGIFYPEIVPQHYENNTERFWDHFFTYLATILGIFGVIYYYKKLYLAQKKETEEKSLEILKVNHELSNTNDQKNKIIALVSHDIRNPLASIAKVLEMMIEGNLSGGDKESAQKELLTMTTNTQKMMENILEWATFELVNKETVITETDIQGPCDSILKIFGALSKQKEIAFRAEFKANPLIRTDVDRMLLILRNLLQNAIKFTPFGGRIDFVVEKHEKQTQILIRDTGIGIPENKLNNLFDLNVEATFGTQNEKGTGLGLYLCKENADKIGATITVESTEGRGTTFTLIFP